MAKAIVDKTTYNSIEEAKKEFYEGMMACDGSEGERYAYAYCMLCEGYNCIDTYKEIAVKRTIRTIKKKKS